MPDTKDRSNNQSKVIPRGEMDRRRNNKQLQRRRLIILCAVIVAVILLIVFFAAGGYEKLLDMLGIKRDISVTPTLTRVECEIRGEPVVSGTGDTVILYDEQGVTGYSSDGKWIWNEPCSLASPVVSYCGDKVVYTDAGGTAAYAFGTNGLVWRKNIDNPIRSVFGNDKYICMIHDENDYLSALTVFEYDSKTASLTELFTKKFGSHYMVTGAVSPDGKQMAVSGVYSDGGSAAGIISFIRMSDGEIFSSESTEDGVYVKLFYTESGKLFAANSDSVRLIYHSLTASSRDDMNSEIWSRDNGQEMLTAAVPAGEDKFMTASGIEGSGKNRIRGYGDNGKERVNFEITGNIISMHSMGDAVLMYTDKYVYLYNENGLLIGQQEAGFAISSAVCVGNRLTAVYGEGNLILVSFK